MLEQFKDIKVNDSPLVKGSLIGHYFLAVKALSTSHIRLKFYEKNKVQGKDQKGSISIHALTAGRSMRGEIKETEEIIYYTIRVSLKNDSKKNLIVSLTSLKGDFLIFANRNGELPSRDQHEFFSEDNHLQLPISQNQSEPQEYIIGVQKSTPISEVGEKFQFTISFSYSSNAIKLVPGLLATYFIQTQSLFYFEIIPDMKDLLIVKSIVDGYNIDLCASFSGSQDITDSENCDFSAPGRQISISLEQSQLK